LQEAGAGKIGFVTEAPDAAASAKPNKG
jgi:hypothetical protein